jgi:hypothetical protein
MIREEFRRALRNNRYEITDEGDIYLPQQGVRIGGIMGNAVRRNGEIIMPWEFHHNVVTTEGINHVLNVTMHDTAKTATWYIGIHTAGAPAIGTTAATYHSTHTETTSYDEATRIEWNTAASTAKSITNSANKATFTMSGTVTVTGAGILSVSTKQSTSGVLLAVASFASSRDLKDDDELLVSYTLGAADDGA